VIIFLETAKLFRKTRKPLKQLLNYY